MKRHTDRATAHDRELDGWADDARHLLYLGAPPLVPIAIQRALWRRSGADRALVNRIRAANGDAGWNPI